MRRPLQSPLLLAFLLFAGSLPASFAAGQFTPPATSVAILRPGVDLVKACQDFYIPTDSDSKNPGATLLLAEVDRSGEVLRAKVITSSGDPALDFAAVSCARSLGAIFIPARVGVLPILSWQQLRIDWPDIASASRQSPQAPFFVLH